MLNNAKGTTIPMPREEAESAAHVSPNSLSLAKGYIGRGYTIIPIPWKSKGPAIAKWQDLRITELTADEYFSGPTNIGVILGEPSIGLTDVDLDCWEAVALAPYFLPATNCIFGRNSRPASHWIYITDLSLRNGSKASVPFRDPSKTTTSAMLVELRIGGTLHAAQTVLPGSMHPSGELVKFLNDGEPTRADGDALTNQVQQLAAGCLLARHWPLSGGRHAAAQVVGGFFSRVGLPPDRIKDIVTAIAEVANDEEAWHRGRTAASAAAAHISGLNAYGLPALRECFGEKVAEFVAKQFNYVDVTRQHFTTRQRLSNIGTSDEISILPTLSEEAIALAFCDKHAEDLRYVGALGKWLYYDGTRWKLDKTLLVDDLVRAHLRDTVEQMEDAKCAKSIASSKTRSAIERLARSDRRMAATIDQWDTDQYLLNTPDGTIDLRTGIMNAHRHSDFITKSTSVGPGGDCPIWQQHLLRVMDGDAEMVDYLQRLFGYASTGDTREHAVAFAYGTGANGKSVTFNTVAGILDEYHRSAPIETFTASNSDRHPTELAGLQGARLVTATETEQGRAWAESRLKSITGGDPVSARYMRGDFFEYKPQFMLMIAGNHKPALKSVDEAIRRRINLVPFTVTIPPESRDEKLTERLAAEWPGILAWIIEGCLNWQREGLNAPAKVKDATLEYLDGEDALLAWIDAECVRDQKHWEPTAKLFASWTMWASQSGEIPGSLKAFSQNLEKHGFAKRRTSVGRGYFGLSVI